LDPPRITQAAGFAILLAAFAAPINWRPPRSLM
jgi:hypothetical protein